MMTIDSMSMIIMFKTNNFHQQNYMNSNKYWIVIKNHQKVWTNNVATFREKEIEPDPFGG
jgi:hypothetical protein